MITIWRSAGRGNAYVLALVEIETNGKYCQNRKYEVELKYFTILQLLNYSRNVGQYLTVNT